MSVLLYAPAVSLVIQAASGTYDVSEDITAGTCTITENGVSTMSVRLLNRGRRYDRLFTPNDRFVLYLKRLTQLPIMTGYLDTVPFFTVWPRTVTVTGSSTLKVLQYRFWDPGTTGSFYLLTSDPQQMIGNTAYNDSGLAVKSIQLATQVGGWPGKNIHFSSLPSTWINKVMPLYNSIMPEVMKESIASVGGVPQGGALAPLQQGVTTTDPTLPGGPVGAEMPVSWAAAVPASPRVASFASAGTWGAQMQWTYRLPDGTATPGVSAKAAETALTGAKLMAVNPDNNQAVVVSPTAWGPSGANGSSSIGLSSAALQALGIGGPGSGNGSSNSVMLAWVTRPNVPLGPFDANSTNLSGTSTRRYANGQPAIITQAGPAVPVTIQAPHANVAVGAAISRLGDPYVWSTAGPNTFDCSGLTMWAWEQAGVDITRTTYTQYAALTPVPGPSSNWLPGDLLFYRGATSEPPPGHVKMYLGNNRTIEAPQSGQVVRYSTINSDGSDNYAGTFYGARRVSASYAANNLVNGGRPDPTYASSGAQTTTPAQSTPGTPSSSILDVWAYTASTTPAAMGLTGYRALAVDTPLLPTFQAITNASMRSYGNAPNGDIIAWFPDYFNQYNCLGVIDVEDIEVKDFTVVWSDTSMVTHQYVAGTVNVTTNLSSGTVGGAVAYFNLLYSAGVATIDFPQILQELFNIPNDDPVFSTRAIYQRFGARPNYQGIGTIVSPLAEFWYALYLFQQNWASMFSASIPLVFMPEVYPGMILRIPSVGFQCYVEKVTHSWSLGEGGGFQTTVDVVAPSSTSGAGLWGFARGG